MSLTHWWLAGWFIEGYQNINHQQPIGLDNQQYTKPAPQALS